MNIKFKNYGGDGKEEVTDIETYFIHRMLSEGDGAVEDAKNTSVNAIKGLGRLVDLLIDKGVIDCTDIPKIIGAFKDDNIHLTDDKKSFFLIK